MITLQFSRNGKIGSYLIRWFTWSKWSHVDIVLEDGSLLGSLLPKGVTVRENNRKDYKLYEIDADYKEVISVATKEIGKGYDWKGLFAIFFRERTWNEENRWLCSELVAHSFEKSGYMLVNSDAWRITPEDLLKSPLLKEVKK